MWSAREDSASERSICSTGATAASSASTAISIAIALAHATCGGLERVAGCYSPTIGALLGGETQIRDAVRTFWPQIPTVRRGARGLGLRPEATLGLRLIRSNGGSRRLRATRWRLRRRSRVTPGLVRTRVLLSARLQCAGYISFPRLPRMPPRRAKNAAGPSPLRPS